MPAYEIVVVVFLVSFVLSLFTGFPIAWLLGGLSLLFAWVGITLYHVFDVDTVMLSDWSRFAILVDRIWNQMEN